MAPKDDADAEILAAVQRFESFLDDYKAGRWGSATISLYFAFEHIVKGLLAAAGMKADSHKGVTTLLSLHFVKPKAIPAFVNRYLSNLEERRSTAEYSPQRAAEFTREEVDSFLLWYKASCDVVLKLLGEYGIDAERLKDLLDEYRPSATGVERE